MALYTEQIKVPCAVILSENDLLVPARKVENYLKSKNVPFRDFDKCTEDFFFSGDEKEVKPPLNTATGAAVSFPTRNNGANHGVSSDGDSTFVTEQGTKDGDDDDEIDSAIQAASVIVPRRHPYMTCALLRGDGHGDWVDHPSESVPTIVAATEALCRRAELIREKKTSE